MPIISTHPAYDAMLSRWHKNRSAIAGQDAIHAGGTDYLPDDNAQNTSQENKDRYKRLLARAVWTPITEYTLQGLIGAVFRKPPVFELPRNMSFIERNSDGAGTSLIQLSKLIASELISVGRIGLLTEYPRSEQGLTRAEVTALGLQPKITVYLAETIDNWSYSFVNGSLKLTMVKLVETKKVMIDPFSWEEEKQYRVLMLNGGIYEQYLYDVDGNIIDGPVVVRDARGSTFDYIPFEFAGAENNHTNVDNAPISGIVDLNIAHYQVTADKRQNLHIHSGGLLTISSKLSVEEWKDANPNGVTVGADKGVFLGDGGNAQLLQLEASSQSQTEIESIQNQAVAVGARLITAKGGNETAEAARIAASGESSVLSNIAGNASEAIESSLKSAAMFVVGVNEEDIKFRLNDDFFESKLSAQDVMSLIQLGDRQIISLNDQRDQLRNGKWIDNNRSNDDIDEDINSQPEIGL